MMKLTASSTHGCACGAGKCVQIRPQDLDKKTEYICAPCSERHGLRYPWPPYIRPNPDMALNEQEDDEEEALQAYDEEEMLADRACLDGVWPLLEKIDWLIDKCGHVDPTLVPMAPPLALPMPVKRKKPLAPYMLSDTPPPASSSSSAPARKRPKYTAPLSPDPDDAFSRADEEWPGETQAQGRKQRNKRKKTPYTDGDMSDGDGDGDPSDTADLEGTASVASMELGAAAPVPAPVVEGKRQRKPVNKGDDFLVDLPGVKGGAMSQAIPKKPTADEIYYVERRRASPGRKAVAPKPQQSLLMAYGDDDDDEDILDMEED
jgi:hypothetical protein